MNIFRKPLGLTIVRLCDERIENVCMYPNDTMGAVWVFEDVDLRKHFACLHCANKRFETGAWYTHTKPSKEEIEAPLETLLKEAYGYPSLNVHFNYGAVGLSIYCEADQKGIENMISLKLLKEISQILGTEDISLCDFDYDASEHNYYGYHASSGLTIYCKGVSI